MKQIVIISALTIFSPLAFSLSETEILQLLVSRHTAAFGQDDLFRNPLSAKELSAWEAIFKDASSFVDVNSKKDSDITRPLSLAQKVNFDLINAIKITRGVLSSKSGLESQIKIFDGIRQEVIAASNKLKNASFYLSKTEKEQARKMLLNMLLFLDTTSMKAGNDARKYLGQAG